MAAKQHNDLLKIGGLAAAAFAGYHFVYKPWKATHDLAAGDLPGDLAPAPLGPLGPFGSPGGGGGGYYNPGASGGFVNTSAGSNNPYLFPSVPAPSTVGYPQVPSNLNPGGQVGGIVGMCMNKKGWTQDVCTARLQKMTAAYHNAQAALAALQSGNETVAVKANLAANQAAMQSDLQQITAAHAAGDAGREQAYRDAYAEHKANVESLSALLAGIPAQVTAYQNAIALLATEFKNATGADIRTLAV